MDVRTLLIPIYGIYLLCIPYRYSGRGLRHSSIIIFSSAVQLIWVPRSASMKWLTDWPAHACSQQMKRWDFFWTGLSKPVDNHMMLDNCTDWFELDREIIPGKQLCRPLIDFDNKLAPHCRTGHWGRIGWLLLENVIFCLQRQCSTSQRLLPREDIGILCLPSVSNFRN